MYWHMKSLDFPVVSHWNVSPIGSCGEKLPSEVQWISPCASPECKPSLAAAMKNCIRVGIFHAKQKALRHIVLKAFSK
jgi:hypothetical protein